MLGPVRQDILIIAGLRLASRAQIYLAAHLLSIDDDLKYFDSSRLILAQVNTKNIIFIVIYIISSFNISKSKNVSKNRYSSGQVSLSVFPKRNKPTLLMHIHHNCQPRNLRQPTHRTLLYMDKIKPTKCSDATPVTNKTMALSKKSLDLQTFLHQQNLHAQRTLARHPPSKSECYHLCDPLGREL
jgi:hypothetical protein